MTRKEITEAIKAHLASGGTGLEYAWPNVPFDFDVKPYGVFTWAAADREGYLGGGRFARETGRMSISVVVEADTGEAEANTLAEAISDLFPAALRIAAGSGTVTITSPPTIRTGYRDGADWRVPVMIQYAAS